MSRGRPTTACIALGANLNDRAASIAAALSQIASLPCTALVHSSDLIETDPVGPIPQPGYLNAAAVVHTTLSARDLLTGLLDIERSLGRDRSMKERWGPRTIDLDLLLYGDLIIDEPGLTIPHPRLHERLFVLTPLASIAPDAVVPTLDATIADLHERLIKAGTQSSRTGSH
jgi:2-amino-4-hydroxy-6-hydroxymethyldihydropteridine diphosphokinase